MGNCDPLNVIGTVLASLFFLTTDLFNPDIDERWMSCPSCCILFCDPECAERYYVRTINRGSGLDVTLSQHNFLLIFLLPTWSGWVTLPMSWWAPPKCPIWVWQGDASIGQICYFLIPTTIGNIIGVQACSLYWFMAGDWRTGIAWSLLI